MSADWKPGDIAVCVELDHAPPRLVLGKRYTVTDVFADVGLCLAEVDPGDHYLGFRQSKFRKLGNGEDAPCDHATAKVPVDA